MIPTIFPKYNQYFFSHQIKRQTHINFKVKVVEQKCTDN